MYECLILDTGDDGFAETPEPHLPFLPIFINGSPPKGITYGTKLQAQNYSPVLKDLIHECLYEKPEHRPTLLQLKTKISNAISEIVTRDGPEGEPTEDMDLPEPLTA